MFSSWLQSPSLRAPATSLRSSRSSLRSRSTQLLVLRFGWIVLVIWYEVGAFFGSLSGCRFPDAPLRQASSHTPTHIVLIADPHVPHPVLSHSEDGYTWVNRIRQGMEELFMRKSWHVVTRLGRIDAVIFVGDMLDQGRAIMSEEEYDDYYALFKSIFKLPPATPTYYVPGNHDIPLGRTGNVFSPYARQRYEEHFGKSNEIVTIANHSIILLDSIGLVEEDYRRYYAEMQFGEWEGIKDGVIEFVQKLGKNPPPSPILISHIPLDRKQAISCGPLREEKGQIQKGVGHGYQNLLGRDTSRFLLGAIQPEIVFSGDDHDYCDIKHLNGVEEVTIKTFSSDAGVRRPGFQLLSLVPPQPDQPSLEHVPCSLPDQIGVYTHVYIPFAILTFAYLLFTNIRAAWARSSVSKGHHHPLSDEKRRERPVPLTLPSRRSAQHLQSLTTMSSSRERHNGLATPNASVPSSPLASPRFGYNESSDPELGISGDIHPSPPMSRRSSFGGGDLNHVGAFGTPRKQSSLLPAPLLSAPQRVSLPRVLSATDWASAARAKDRSVLSLVSDRRRPYIERIKALFQWVWRTRKSVLASSWWETISIALPAAIVWLVMNTLFFRN